MTRTNLKLTYLNLLKLAPLNLLKRALTGPLTYRLFRDINMIDNVKHKIHSTPE